MTEDFMQIVLKQQQKIGKKEEKKGRSNFIYAWDPVIKIHDVLWWMRNATEFIKSHNFRKKKWEIMWTWQALANASNWYKIMINILMLFVQINISFNTFRLCKLCLNFVVSLNYLTISFFFMPFWKLSTFTVLKQNTINNIMNIIFRVENVM